MATNGTMAGHSNITRASPTRAPRIIAPTIEISDYLPSHEPILVGLGHDHRASAEPVNGKSRKQKSAGSTLVWTSRKSAYLVANEAIGSCLQRLRTALGREVAVSQKANQNLQDEIELEKKQHQRTKEKLRLEDDEHQKSKEEFLLKHRTSEEDFAKLIEELQIEHRKELSQLKENLQCKICYTQEDRWGRLQRGRKVCLKFAESIGKPNNRPSCRKLVTGLELQYGAHRVHTEKPSI